MAAKFCIECGSRMELIETNENHRLKCTNCGWIYYQQLIVGSGAIIEKDGQILLIERALEPFQFYYGIPSGHVEANEDPATAAIREVREETGLKIEIDGLFGIYFFDDHPRGKGIHIVYKSHISGSELKQTHEGLNPTFFSRENIPKKIAGGGHSQAILAWKNPNKLERAEIWNQLSNTINLRSSQDQVLWSIFGTFWAANAILLVALFTTGKLPESPIVGIVVSIVGVILSFTWHIIQKRALAYIIRHEDLMSNLEGKLEFEPELAVSADINQSLSQKYLNRGPKARTVMSFFCLGSGFLWLSSLFYFCSLIFA